MNCFITAISSRCIYRTYARRLPTVWSCSSEFCCFLLCRIERFRQISDGERIYTKFRRISMQDISSDKLGPLLYVRIDWAKRGERDPLDPSMRLSLRFYTLRQSEAWSITSIKSPCPPPRRRPFSHLPLVDFHPGMTIISNVMNDVLFFLHYIYIEINHPLGFSSIKFSE